jgi:predicted nucleic acid-binding protein
MKLSLGSIIDFIAMTILILIGVSLISMHLNTQTARNYHALAVNEIENCNFSATVINALKADAAQMGYALDIRKFSINDGLMAEVALNYNYSIPLLNIMNTPQVIRGTAR